MVSQHVDQVGVLQGRQRGQTLGRAGTVAVDRDYRARTALGHLQDRADIAGTPHRRYRLRYSPNAWMVEEQDIEPHVPVWDKTGRKS